MIITAEKCKDEWRVKVRIDFAEKSKKEIIKYIGLCGMRAVMVKEGRKVVKIIGVEK